MTSPVLGQAIKQMDKLLDNEHNGLPQHVAAILNDLSFIEHVLWKHGQATHNINMLAQYVAKARATIEG